MRFHRSAYKWLGKNERRRGPGRLAFIPSNRTGSEEVGVLLCEFRSEQEYLGRVIYPEEQQYERAGRPEKGGRGGMHEVEADERLSDREEHRGYGRPHPDVFPFDRCAGKEFIDHSEQKHAHGKQENKVQRLQEKGMLLYQAAAEVRDILHHGTEDNGNHDDERHGQRDHEGKETGADEIPHSPGVFRFAFPDVVESILQFDKDARGADNHRDKTNYSGDETRRGVHPALKDGFYHLGAGVSGDHGAFFDHRVFDRSIAEERAGNGRYYDQDRRYGKKGVEGERRSPARPPVGDPGLHGPADYHEGILPVAQPAPRQIGRIHGRLRAFHRHAPHEGLCALNFIEDKTKRRVHE